MNILNVTEAPGWSGGTNQMLLTARELTREAGALVRSRGSAPRLANL